MNSLTTITKKKERRKSFSLNSLEMQSHPPLATNVSTLSCFPSGRHFFSRHWLLGLHWRVINTAPSSSSQQPRRTWEQSKFRFIIVDYTADFNILHAAHLAFCYALPFLFFFLLPWRTHRYTPRWPHTHKLLCRYVVTIYLRWYIWASELARTPILSGVHSFLRPFNDANDNLVFKPRSNTLMLSATMSAIESNWSESQRKARAIKHYVANASWLTLTAWRLLTCMRPNRLQCSTPCIYSSVRISAVDHKPGIIISCRPSCYQHCNVDSHIL